MRFHFWEKSQPKRLPRRVREYMRQRFDLLPEYLDTLRCFEYDGLLNEKRIRCVRIFNPYLVQRHMTIRNDADLDQHPEVLLYEGYVDAQGGVDIEDRRTMSYPQNTSRRL